MYRPSPIAGARAADPQAPSFWLDLFLSPALIFMNAEWMRMLAIYILPLVCVAGASASMFVPTPGWGLRLVIALAFVLLGTFGPIYYSMTVIMTASMGQTRLPESGDVGKLWRGIFFAVSSNFILLVTYFVPPALLWLFFDWRVAVAVFLLSCFLFPMAWMLTSVSHSALDANPVTAAYAVFSAPLPYLVILLVNASILVPLTAIELVIDWEQVTEIGLVVYRFGVSFALHVLNILTAFLLGRLHFHYYGSFKNDGPPRFDPDPEFAEKERRDRTRYFASRLAASMVLLCISAVYLALIALMPTLPFSTVKSRFLAVANAPSTQMARELVPEAKTSKALDETADTVKKSTKDAIEQIKKQSEGR